MTTRTVLVLDVSGSINLRILKYQMRKVLGTLELNERDEEHIAAIVTCSHVVEAVSEYSSDLSYLLNFGFASCQYSGGGSDLLVGIDRALLHGADQVLVLTDEMEIQRLSRLEIQPSVQLIKIAEYDYEVFGFEFNHIFSEVAHGMYRSLQEALR